MNLWLKYPRESSGTIEDWFSIEIVGCIRAWNLRINERNIVVVTLVSRLLRSRLLGSRFLTVVMAVIATVEPHGTSCSRCARACPLDVLHSWVAHLTVRVFHIRLTSPNVSTCVRVARPECQYLVFDSVCRPPAPRVTKFSKNFHDSLASSFWDSGNYYF